MDTLKYSSPQVATGLFHANHALQSWGTTMLVNLYDRRTLGFTVFTDVTRPKHHILQTQVLPIPKSCNRTVRCSTSLCGVQSLKPGVGPQPGLKKTAEVEEPCLLDYLI